MTTNKTSAPFSKLVDTAIETVLSGANFDFSTDDTLKADAAKAIIAAHEADLREALEKLSWAVVQPCEPECNRVSHALYEGSWNAHLIIEEYLAQLPPEDKQAQGQQ